MNPNSGQPPNDLMALADIIKQQNQMVSKYQQTQANQGMTRQGPAQPQQPQQPRPQPQPMPQQPSMPQGQPMQQGGNLMQMIQKLMQMRQMQSGGRPGIGPALAGPQIR